MEDKKEKIFLPKQIAETMERFPYPKYISWVVCEKEPSKIHAENTIYHFLNEVTGEIGGELSGQQFAAISSQPQSVVIYTAKGNGGKVYEITDIDVCIGLVAMATPMSGRETFLNGSICPYLLRVDPFLVGKVNQKIEESDILD